MANIEKLKAMRIGCDNAVWAPLKSDDGTAATTFATRDDGEPIVFALEGVMSININPNSSIETAFYDDGPGEVASTLGNIEVTFNKSALSHIERSLLLGKAYNAQGILFHNKNDVAPWGALGFRTLKSDGTYKYIWLYKGKFTEPVDNNETKGDTINFQSDEIVGRFVKLNWEYTLDDWQASTKVEHNVRPWKIELDDSDFGGELVDNVWFNQVMLPNLDILPSDWPTTDLKGYVVWESKDGVTTTMARLKDNTAVTTMTLAAKKYSFPDTEVITYWEFTKGKWTKKEVATTAPTIDADNDSIMYSSKKLASTAGSKETIITEIKLMPGITVA